MPKDNTTVYILLGLLQHEESSGYDLKKKIDVMISGFWDVGYGQIYPALAKMEKDGLVVKRSGAGAKGADKYVYSITDKGRGLLQRWLLLSEAKEYTKYEMLLKLFFGSLAPGESSLNRIREFGKRHQQNMQLIRMFKSNLEAVLDAEEDHFYYYLTVLFGERVYQAYVDWSDEAAAMLAERQAGMARGPAAGTAESAGREMGGGDEACERAKEQK